MSERINLFEKAKQKCMVFVEMNPEWATPLSIINQLQFLINIENGSCNEYVKLKKIILGIQASREIEQESPELGDMLHEISGIVEQMKEEHGIKAKKPWEI